MYTILIVILPSNPEFDKWVDRLSDNSAQSFTKTTPKRDINGVLYKRYLKCNRGGTAEPSRGHNLREPKSQGSCKIGRPCTAEMVSTIKVNRVYRRQAFN